MKRIRIEHRTAYHYDQPVSFGPRRAMLRPREGHDVHIVRGRLDVEPVATICWLRDVYSNSIAALTFAEPSRKLAISALVSRRSYRQHSIARGGKLPGEALLRRREDLGSHGGAACSAG